MADENIERERQAAEERLRLGVARALKKFRLLKQWDEKKLADESNVAPRQIKNTESVASLMDLDVFSRVLLALGVTWTDFFTEVDVQAGNTGDNEEDQRVRGADDDYRGLSTVLRDGDKEQIALTRGMIAQFVKAIEVRRTHSPPRLAKK